MANKRKTPPVDYPTPPRPPPPPPLPEYFVENFKPIIGDVIIREIPHIASPRVLAVLGILKIYRDDYFLHYEGAAHDVKFTFLRGDHILRTGCFHGCFTDAETVYGSRDAWYWHKASRAELFLYWPRTDNGRLGWHLVAKKENVILYDGARESHIDFAQNVLHIRRNYRFKLLPGDFLIHDLPVEDLARPWGKSYQLRVVPRDYHDENEYAAQICGVGDFAVRVRVISPWPEQAAEDKSAPMYVYAFLCVGADGRFAAHRTIGFRWRYMGYDHYVFRDYHSPPFGISGPPKESGFLQTVPWLPKLANVPVRYGDVIFNLEESLHEVHNHPWVGGHIVICHDGPTLEGAVRRESLPGSMILRLGSFMLILSELLPDAWARDIHELAQNNYSVWHDEKVELFMHDQLTQTGWTSVLEIPVPLPDPGAPEGTSTYAPPNQNFEQQFDRCYRIQVGSEARLRPGPRDFIFSRHPWADHVDYVYGHSPLVPEHLETPETYYVEGRGELTDMQCAFEGIGREWEADNYLRGTIDELNMDQEHYVVSIDDNERVQLNRPENERRRTSLRFWHPRMRIQDGDCLIRFGSRATNPENGQWILSVELYMYCSLPGRWRADPGAAPRRDPVDRPHWGLLGRDYVIFPVDRGQLVPIRQFY